MRRLVYTLMLVFVLTAPASAQQVCEEIPTGWMCYIVDGPTKPWDVRTGPVEDYGQVFLGPVPGAAGGFQAWFSFVSTTRAQSAWVQVWPEGGQLVVLRVRLEPNVRRSVTINNVPGVAGFNAVSVRIRFESDVVVGAALHGDSVIVLR